MTLEDYRNDKERSRFAQIAVASMPGEPRETARNLVHNHHGQHVACISCAIVALYFDVELTLVEREGN